MSRILRDLNDPDHDDVVSFSTYVADAEKDAAYVPLDEALRQCEREAVKRQYDPSISDVTHARLAAKLNDHLTHPSTYECIYGGMRVAPAVAERCDDVRKTKDPEQRIAQWRRPGVRFVPPKNRRIY